MLRNERIVWVVSGVLAIWGVVTVFSSVKRMYGPKNVQEVFEQIKKSGNVGGHEFGKNKLRDDGPELPYVVMTMVGDYTGPGWSTVTVTDISSDNAYASNVFESLPSSTWSSVRVLDPKSQIYMAKTDRFLLVGWGKNTVSAVLSYVD